MAEVPNSMNKIEDLPEQESAMEIIKTMDIDLVAKLASEGWSYSRPYIGELEDGTGGKMWTVYEDPTKGEYIKVRKGTGSKWPFRWVEIPVIK